MEQWPHLAKVHDAGLMSVTWIVFVALSRVPMTFDLVARKLHGLLLVVQFIDRLGRGIVQNELSATLYATQQCTP